jgi:hypothetical protein
MAIIQTVNVLRPLAGVSGIGPAVVDVVGVVVVVDDDVGKTVGVFVVAGTSDIVLVDVAGTMVDVEVTVVGGIVVVVVVEARVVVVLCSVVVVVMVVLGTSVVVVVAVVVGA